MWATTGPSTDAVVDASEATEADPDESEPMSGASDEASPSMPGAHAAAVPTAAAPTDASRKNLRRVIPIRPPLVTTRARVAPSTTPGRDLDESAVRGGAALRRAGLLRRHRRVGRRPVRRHV